MDELAYFPRLILICLLFMIPSMYCENVCVKKTACRCEFSNGTFIDFTSSANNVLKSSTAYGPRRQTEAMLNTFYYQPCYDSFDRQIIRTYPPYTNNCNDPFPLCRHTKIWNVTTPDTLKTVEEYYEYIGNSGDPQFAPDGSYITYFNLPSPKVIIYLVCAKSDDRLEIKDLSDPSGLELVLYSRNVCLQPENSAINISSWNVPFMQIACRTLLQITNSTLV